MADRACRKALHAGYEQAPAAAGVYRLVNRATGRSLVGATTNLGSVAGKLAFAQAIGKVGLFFRRAQADIARHGIAAFERRSSMAEVLPPGYVTRPPRPDEVAAVADLIIATDLVEYGQADYSVKELAADWRELDLDRNAWVVTAPNGAIAGYGSLWELGGVDLNADVYVHPEQTGRGIGTQLVRVSEARAREYVPLAPPDARVVLHNHVNSANAAACELLRGEGYAAVPYFLRMIADLDEPPPAPEWPAGLRVHVCVPGEDEPRFYAASEEAMRDHWGHVPLSFEAWRKEFTGEHFAPEL